MAAERSHVPLIEEIRPMIAERIQADVRAHALHRMAGHGSLLTTQLHLHPDMARTTNVGHALTARLNPIRTPSPSPSSRHQDGAAGARGPRPAPKNTERRYRISPIPPVTCENTSRDDRI
ncbi:MULTISPECIES: hypothetical protein [unclassified Streptomyces]|uniref:hypothetical protein n=1 Tax=unclassified Streptomyces TaxID=2593676 RepID=UPI00114CDEEC|nr:MULTISPECIES: hypothetical protein [unclassified Streptomyces]MYQ82502.1 hypothetical protein [Streptomyces sp. SID4936]